MAHFEIQTEIPTLFNQKQALPKQAFNGFVATDDDNTLVSPISSIDTCSSSSRRSSFSSLASSSPGNLIRHSRSLQLDHDKSILYPTKQSAYDRIEFLEEQLRIQHQFNETLLKNKSSTISNEFNSGLLDKMKGESSDTDRVMNKLQELKQLVTDYHVELSQNKDQSNPLQTKVYFSTQIIENWIQCVTQLNSLPTKQGLKNVMLPLLYRVEKEQNRNNRLVEGLNRLKQQKQTASKTTHQLKSRVTTLERTTEQLRQQLAKVNQQRKEETAEMEQVIEEMRQEMESMIDELDQLKAQKETAPLKSQEGPDYARIISTHAQQVEALEQEKKELRSRLIQAEQRTAAELDLLMAVEQTKNKSDQKELEEALKRTLAERDAELAKTKQELNKLKKQIDRVQQYNEKQIEREVNARLEELETQLRMAHQKDTDTYKLQISREVRDLSGQLVEFEAELQALERQHLQDQQSIENAIQSQFNVEETLRMEKSAWEKREHELRMNITKSEQRIISLEQEVLVLYSKNLDMAKHLCELEI